MYESIDVWMHECMNVT